MSVRKISQEQPPRDTARRLKEWLARLAQKINASLASIQEEIDRIDSDVGSIELGKLDAIEPGASAAYQGWRDLTAEITTRGSGANNPTWTKFIDDGAGSQGIFAYEFEHNKNREFWMVFHVDHDYAIGTDIFFHVHFSLQSNSSGNIGWACEYTIAQGHQQGTPSVFSNTSTANMQVAVDANSAYEHHVAEVSVGISDSDLEPDCLILCRFYRDNTVVNNIAASVWGFTADIHYQVDRYSTKNRLPDFYT